MTDAVQAQYTLHLVQKLLLLVLLCSLHCYYYYINHIIIIKTVPDWHCRQPLDAKFR